MRERLVRLPALPSLDLGVALGPVRWAGSSNPRMQLSGTSALFAVREGAGAGIVRAEENLYDENWLSASGAVDPLAWSKRCLRPSTIQPWEDPVIATMDARFPGLWSLCDGSLFEGLLTSIIGQSISLASASAVQRRLCADFSPGIEATGSTMYPLPPAMALAEASVDRLRAAGMTTRRAAAIITIASEEVQGNLPTEQDVMTNRSAAERDLRSLPQVGPWTVASALLWGIGHPDAYPHGDVALLRAARVAYDDSAMTMNELQAISERWKPRRAIATRLLWTSVLGPAW